MNFLGHAVVAQHGSDAFLLGNLIADGVKGALPTSGWPSDVIDGMRCHREIDAWIDHHPAVMALKTRVPPATRRVAGIGLDMIWDHFLARDMLDPSLQVPELQPALMDRVYDTLTEHEALIPPAMKPMFEALVRERWLESYARYTTTCHAIGRIGLRLRGENRLQQLTPWLIREQALLEETYHELWPDLLRRATAVKGG
ncbi:acyl carrier protein phosphodiesterase [Larsenimonas rhizosphaerae]|uniref:ACP phosphodiesterase n=1 Tax=Larsenimonas rhizosphaerae TaxID=2944682 RepID=A0AA42CX15_9GAMM|nr:ACP phosphodiesterase [Larsenimonas rhizosphaerae]MCX2523343.1 ACP phosphodiesterase [Larsenimonas rhizosphaerae]